LPDATINQQVTVSSSQTATAIKKKVGFKEKREFELLEKEIADLETEKQQLEEQLSNTGAPFEQLNLLSKRIGEISTLLSDKEMRWLELSEMM
jgi:ATP-binding cassette subfamily F protein uup